MFSLWQGTEKGAVDEAWGLGISWLLSTGGQRGDVSTRTRILGRNCRGVNATDITDGGQTCLILKFLGWSSVEVGQ